MIRVYQLSKIVNDCMNNTQTFIKGLPFLFHKTYEITNPCKENYYKFSHYAQLWEIIDKKFNSAYHNRRPFSVGDIEFTIHDFERIYYNDTTYVPSAISFKSGHELVWIDELEAHENLPTNRRKTGHIMAFGKSEEELETMIAILLVTL